MFNQCCSTASAKVWIVNDCFFVATHLVFLQTILKEWVDVSVGTLRRLEVIIVVSGKWIAAARPLFVAGSTEEITFRLILIEAVEELEEFSEPKTKT